MGHAMPDHRDFEEPFAAPDATPNEQNTRWILAVCFGILILAGIAFASIGTFSQPVASAFLSDNQRQPPETLIISRRAPRGPPAAGQEPGTPAGR
jgi:hypothetical protein